MYRKLLQPEKKYFPLLVIRIKEKKKDVGKFDRIKNYERNNNFFMRKAGIASKILIFACINLKLQLARLKFFY